MGELLTQIRAHAVQPQLTAEDLPYLRTYALALVAAAARVLTVHRPVGQTPETRWCAVDLGHLVGVHRPSTWGCRTAEVVGSRLLRDLRPRARTGDVVPWPPVLLTQRADQLPGDAAAAAGPPVALLADLGERIDALPAATAEERMIRRGLVDVFLGLTQLARRWTALSAGTRAKLAAGTDELAELVDALTITAERSASWPAPTIRP